MTVPKRAPRVPFALLVTTLLVGGLGLLLALNTASAANELERHSLATKDQLVGAQVQQLRNEVALGSAPGNLQQAAAALGMVPAGNPAFIVLGTDGSATLLGKPKAVAGVPLAIAPAPTKAKATKPAVTKTPAKPTTSKTPASSKTPSSTRTSGRPTKTTGARTKTPVKTPAPSTPTPTPTPTLTLPGGNR